MHYNRHKIIAIEGVPSCGSFLIAMHRDTEGVDFVELSAWHRVEGGQSKFQYMKLYFNSSELAEKFISCYPPEMAYVTVRNFYEEMILQDNVKKIKK